MPLGVCTSKAESLADPLVRGLGLGSCFSAIVGSDPALPHEPKAETVARAMDRVPGAAVLVGDTVFDVEAAHANGLPCVGVLWGIGTRNQLEDARADAIIEFPRDLPGVLDQVLGTPRP